MCLFRSKDVLKDKTETMAVFLLETAKLFDDQGVVDGGTYRIKYRGPDQSRFLPVAHQFFSKFINLMEADGDSHDDEIGLVAVIFPGTDDRAGLFLGVV